jgi:alpha-1,2-mannosyltransferase
MIGMATGKQSDATDGVWTPRRAIAVLRDASWLTPERARAWCVVLATISLSAAIITVALSRNGLDIVGRPLGTDFVSFWTASRLALTGHPGSVYDPVTLNAAERSLFPSGRPDFYAFFYPPTFLLLCLPLAALPYLTSLILWLTGGAIALLACIRRLLPQRWAVLPILAYPGMLINIGHGQNGFLSASCFGGGMLLLQRWPVLAGLCLGGLAFKPHLALAVPVALVAARRWKVLAGAAVSSLGLFTLSWIVLGRSAWTDWFSVSSLARASLEGHLVGDAKMPSVFAAVRLLHGTVGGAYAAQVAATLGVGILLTRTAIRRPGAHAEGAVIVASTLMCTPFLLDYDLVCLSLPLAWVVAEAQRTGWYPWEKITLLLAYGLPLFARSLATGLGVPLAPCVLGALLLVVIRRAHAVPLLVAEGGQVAIFRARSTRSAQTTIDSNGALLLPSTTGTTPSASPEAMPAAPILAAPARKIGEPT